MTVAFPTVLTAVPPAVAVFALALAVLRLPRRVGHAFGAAGALAVTGWLLAVPAGQHVHTTLFGFEAVLFHVDVYSRLLAATFGLIAAVGTGYAYAMGGDQRQTALALCYVGSGVGAAVAGDWLTLVVYWELLAAVATVLLWYRSSDRGVGTRYAIYHEIGGLALIAGVLLHYASTETFLFGDGITAGLPAVLVALGIGLNAGFVGLHVWIVDSYSRTHVATSAVLAAITTKVGAYAVVRAFPDGQFVIAHVGGVMVLVGVTFAVLQSDVRRLLCYSIVAQVGYMVAGFGAGTALASAGALAHMVNHVLYKTLLFMVAGVLIHRTGVEDLEKLGGLRRPMPLAAVAFSVAVLSTAGIPGFSGFVSKGMILDGVQKAGYDALWYALVLGGVGTVVTFAKFGYEAFLRGDETVDHADLRPVELGALGTLATLCVVLGTAPGLLLSLLPPEGVAAAEPFAAKQFPKVAGVTAAGLVAFVAIRGPLSRVTPVPDLDAVYTPLGRRLQTVAVDGSGAVEDGIDLVAGWLRDLGRTVTAPPPRLRDRVPSPSTRSIGAGVLALALVLGFLLTLVVV